MRLASLVADRAQGRDQRGGERARPHFDRRALDQGGGHELGLRGDQAGPGTEAQVGGGEGSHGELARCG